MQNNVKPFVSIDEASRLTGLSRFYIRNGIRAGEIQHIMSGTKYLVNLPVLFSRLGLPWPSITAETVPGLLGQGKAIRK